MERMFPFTAADADLVFHALRYYAAEMFEAFVEDDEASLLDDAVQADELADRLRRWIVANHQSLVREAAG